MDNMKSKTKKLCIYGVGGFGREALACYKDQFGLDSKEISSSVIFMDDNPEVKGTVISGVIVCAKTDIDFYDYDFFIAVGDPSIRKQMVDSLPSDVSFATIIHPSAVVSESVRIGVGSIITANCVLTCDINVGKHAHFNLHSTVGHDTVIGDYFTTAPAVNISGNCHIDNMVYFGTNACIKQGLNVTQNVTIGMGGVVVKDINESGVYIGAPCKLLKRN